MADLISKYVDICCQQVEAKLELGEFLQHASRNASMFNRTGFSQDIDRQLKKLIYIVGNAALENKDDFEKVC